MSWNNQVEFGRHFVIKKHEYGYYYSKLKDPTKEASLFSYGNQQSNITVVQIWQHAPLYKVLTAIPNTMPGAWCTSLIRWWHVNHLLPNGNFLFLKKQGIQFLKRSTQTHYFCLSTRPSPCISPEVNSSVFIVPQNEIQVERILF